jgi:hypothetical protein
VRVGTATGSGAARATPLISLTVTGVSPTKVAKATDTLADLVVGRTTAPYVGTKIATYESVLKTTNNQLTSITKRLAVLDRAVAQSHLSAIDQLVLVSQVDNAEQRQGNLLDQKATTQQQLAFAQEVESAKVITTAKAEKASAHSKPSSLLVGAFIGLIVGAIVAIAGEGRFRTA